MASLSPIDLLSMSAGEQAILRCLTRQPRMTAAEIAAQTKISLAEIEESLNALRRQSQIVEQLHNGRRVFSVRFQFERRAVRNMPASIMGAFQPSLDHFLADVPLTASLPAEVAQELLRISRKRVLLPEEVLAWQGEKLDEVMALYNGLLSKTRLKGRQTGQKAGYVQRAEWVGLGEVFSEGAVEETYTAVTETTLFSWPATQFLDFAARYSELALAVGRHFSRRLRGCERPQGQGRLWVIEGAHPQAGATTFAAQLAWQARQNDNEAKSGRVLLWDMTRYAESRPKNSPADPTGIGAGADAARKQAHGVDLLCRPEQADYPPQAHLDVLLSELSARYDYIICDTGAATDDELILRLRGRAQTLITLTKDEHGAEEGGRRWQALRPYAAPGQKRVLALNGAKESSAQVDARFHLVIPYDAGQSNNGSYQNGVDGGSLFPQALQEVYNRLSLNHALAIFVPSTIDVDCQVDNSAQVQETLSFLGHKFGGATSSNAEGVWRSEESGLVTEQVTIVRTFVSRQALDAYLDDVIYFATDLKKNMKQEAVAITVDNQLILV